MTQVRYAPLEKISISKMRTHNTNSSSGCCDGSPATNADACCKLDEDKKAAGESGCGCHSSESGNKQSCC
jgi:hypothetical protein